MVVDCAIARLLCNALLAGLLGGNLNEGNRVSNQHTVCTFVRDADSCRPAFLKTVRTDFDREAEFVALLHVPGLLTDPVGMIHLDLCLGRVTWR